jgi:hypothetical protein
MIIPEFSSKLFCLDDTSGICIQLAIFTRRKNPKESMTVSIDGMDNFKYRFPRKVLVIVIRNYYLNYCMTPTGGRDGPGPPKPD